MEGMEYLVLLGLALFIFFMLRFIVSSDREEKKGRLKKSNDEAQRFYRAVPDSVMRDTGIWIDIK